MGPISTADVGLGSQPELLAGLGVAVIGTDLLGSIRGWNGAAARLYGRDAHEMLGMPIESIGVATEDQAVAVLIVRRLLSVGRWQGELAIEDANGSPLRLDVRAAVLLDSGQRPVGFEAVLLDVSGRVAADQRAAELESQLRVAHRITGLGAWEWDPQEDRLVTSDAFTSLLGLEPEMVLTMGDALAVMPTGDRERVQSAIDGMRRGGPDAFSVEYRVLGADGTVRWLEAHCDAVRGEDGMLARVRGVTQDVTERVVARSQSQEGEEFGLATLDSLAAHVAVLDADGDVVAVNASWRRFAEGAGAGSDYVGSNYLAVCEADPEAQAVARGVGELLAGEREVFELEYPCHGPSVQRWFLLRATRYAGSGPSRVVVMHADITERHEAQEQATLQAALLDEIDVAVIVISPDLRVVSWNAGAEQLYGWTRDEAMGRPPEELVVPDDATSNEPIIAALRRDGCWDGEYVLRRRDGSTFPGYVRNRVILDSAGGVKAFVGVSMDMSERKKSERALLSARDYLRAVTDSMGEGVLTQDSEGRVSYLNQVAEDLLGWSQEELQGQVMHSLIHHRTPDGSPSPIEECPIVRARRDGEVVHVEDDIFIHHDGSELPVAYTAAPFATDDGIEGCVVVFEDITDRKAAARSVERDLAKLAWVDRIQAALTEERFVLYAQPIIDLHTGDVAQCELLLRMRSVDESGTDVVIAPGDFLPVAEEYGLITEIDRWVIDRSAEIAATGEAVELNVSARSISDPSLVDYINHAIARTAADPAMMVFEITETTMISDEAAARAFVERLHDLGCQVALDDFGTGYGGFTYLKQLPLDYLKIDIEFVRDLRENTGSRNVVRGIVNLAHGFGLKTVGEGVEDQQTLDLLRELGVDYGQGFHIGRPSPLQDASQHHDSQGSQR